MKYHIFEHCGVMLDVQYTNDPDGHPHFHSVRVMDSQYRPTGPDLRHLLHQALLIVNPPSPRATVEAQTFLSAIAQELP